MVILCCSTGLWNKASIAAAQSRNNTHHPPLALWGTAPRRTLQSSHMWARRGSFGKCFSPPRHHPPSHGAANERPPKRGPSAHKQCTHHHRKLRAPRLTSRPVLPPFPLLALRALFFFAQAGGCAAPSRSQSLLVVGVERLVSWSGALEAFGGFHLAVSPPEREPAAAAARGRELSVGGDPVEERLVTPVGRPPRARTTRGRARRRPTTWWRSESRESSRRWEAEARLASPLGGFGLMLIEKNNHTRRNEAAK